MRRTDRSDGRVATLNGTLIPFVLSVIVVLVISFAMELPAIAQTPGGSAASPSTNAPAATSSPADPAMTSTSAAKKHRQPPPAKVLPQRSFFFPDFAHGGQPLTPGDKFRLAATNSVSPATFLGSSFAAGVSQAVNSPAGWGQGADAYGQRFGASMASRASTNLLGNFALCSALHDDPRFFVMGDGSLKQSIKYAVRRVVIIRKDNGDEAFNWPGVLAPLGAAGIANTYLPDAQRTVGYTFESYGWSLAGSAGVNLLKEYWPTITRKVLVPLGMIHEDEKP